MEESNVELDYDHTEVVVIKGKRTKRARFSVNTASSCSSGGCNITGGGCGGSEISTCTDDDEDVANCLILLAQSGHDKTSTSHGRSSIQIESHEKILTSSSTSSSRSSIQIESVQISTLQKNDEGKLKLRKASSKRFCDTPINGGKDGMYVYECKTCNRIFPSFQALGGHRASHRKAPQPPLPQPPSSGESEKIHRKEEKQLVHVRHTARKHTFYRGPVKTGPPTNVTDLSRIFRRKNEKVHECSICSLEFSSGQALGGHMRKHRNVPTNITKIESNITTESSEIDNDGGERSRNILRLDLNLPAPPEVDHREFSVLCFPALVECQY